MLIVYIVFIILIGVVMEVVFVVKKLIFNSILEFIVLSIIMFLFYQHIWYGQVPTFSYFDFYEIVNLTKRDIVTFNINLNRYLFLYIIFYFHDLK